MMNSKLEDCFKNLMCDRHINILEKVEKNQTHKKNFETSLTFVFNVDTLGCMKVPFSLLKNSEIMYIQLFFKN